MILYTYILENGLLLRNISKMYCQSAKICYNKGVATFWQHKIQQARINDVIEVKIGVYLHKT